MLFKLIWILVLAWIAVRVYRAGKELMGLATGAPRSRMRGQPPADKDSATVVTKPAREPAPETTGRRDVEDAKFKDLS